MRRWHVIDISTPMRVYTESDTAVQIWLESENEEACVRSSRAQMCDESGFLHRLGFLRQCSTV